MHISESFQQLLRVDQESAWCDALFDFGRGLGFDRCLVAIVSNPGMGLEQAYLRSNYPTDWRSFYDTQKLVHVDPTVAHCVAHSTSLIWSPGLFRSSPQRVMYEEASGYGLRSGITLPMHGNPNQDAQRQYGEYAGCDRKPTQAQALEHCLYQKSHDQRLHGDNGGLKLAVYLG